MGKSLRLGGRRTGATYPLLRRGPKPRHEPVGTVRLWSWPPCGWSFSHHSMKKPLNTKSASVQNLIHYWLGSQGGGVPPPYFSKKLRAKPVKLFSFNKRKIYTHIAIKYMIYSTKWIISHLASSDHFPPNSTEVWRFFSMQAHLPQRSPQQVFPGTQLGHPRAGHHPRQILGAYLLGIQ